MDHPVESPPDVRPSPPGPHYTAGVQQQLVGAAQQLGVDKLHPGHTPGVVTLPVLGLQCVAVTSNDLQATLVVTEEVLFGGQIPANQSILMIVFRSLQFCQWDVTGPVVLLVRGTESEPVSLATAADLPLLLVVTVQGVTRLSVL